MTTQAHRVSIDTRNLSIEPVAIDDEGVLQRVLAEVDQKLGAPTARINLDLQTAADTVTGVIAGLRTDAELYARYKTLAAAGETDFAVLSRLNRYAPALWFAAYRTKLEREASTRVVTETALARYNELRDELVQVLLYNYEDDAVEGPRLRAIARGPDQLVLANNLRYLADLAIERADDLARDRKHDPAHVQEALAASTELRAALGAKELPEVRWLDRAAVLWTLVQRDFAELTEVGRFLLRTRPDEARRRFPSLVRTGGARGPRTTGDGDAHDDSEGDAPANDAPANDATKPAVEAKPEVEVKPVVEAKPAAKVATKPAVKKGAGAKTKRAKRG